MKKRSEGWHSDYTQKHELRYCDGSNWTEHVSDQGVAGVDPLPLVPEAAAEVAPAETLAAAPVETEAASSASGGTQAWPTPTAAATPAPGASGLSLPFTAKGVSGQVTVDEHFVTISRSGLKAKLAQGGVMRGEKHIPITSIQAVTLKKPGVTNGYIQFTIPGGNEASR